MPQIRDPKKFAYIDALRGLAILGVMMTHCHQRGNNALLQSFIDSGEFGVQLFFIVSALTLFMSMKERITHEKYPVLNFFIRRFFRIAPLFYLSILYYIGQAYFESGHWLQDISKGHILALFTFTFGFNPYWISAILNGWWTIAVEMIFYLTLPYLFKTVTNLKSAVYLTIIAFLSTQLLHYILKKTVHTIDPTVWSDYLYRYFPTQLPIFLLGIVLYFMIKNQQDANNKDDSIADVWLVIILGIMIQLIFQTKYGFLHAFSFGCTFLLLVYSLALKPTKLFVNRFTTFIGRISFSMYLVHFAVLKCLISFSKFTDFITNPFLNFGIKYLLLLGATVGISFMTYTMIEKPGQNMGKKLINILNK